ncbi:MAG: DUF3014 domain-containing protein [Betaproteobacteria bacterium]|nr:DUF3014 domain-containing protein [Betaproteobacteria bacterium]
MNSPAPAAGPPSSGEAAPPRRWWIWVILVVVAGALIAAAWMLMKPDPRRNAPGAVSSAPKAGQTPPSAASGTGSAPGAVTPGSTEASGTAASGAPAGAPAAPAGAGSPRYPVERILGADSPIDPASAALDAAASDKAIAAALGNFPGREQLLRFVLPADIVQKIVLTIDNLPGDSMSMQYRAVVATPGSFQIERRDGEPAIATQNARRYDAFVAFASGLDTRRLVALYKRFYPLFQKTYRSIGYPEGHFNDRVVQAIDDLLAAPSPAGAIFLDQPRVLYEFAESSLERRSVGQRIMIRVGPEHAAKLKAKLRELRAVLTQES